MRIANTNAKDYVRKRLSFKGNNLFSELLVNGYVVYSYGYHYPLFVYVNKACQWYGNSDKRSITTSKHKTQCEVSEYAEGSTEWLQEIIKSLS